MVRDLPGAIDALERALEVAVSIGNGRSEAMAAWLLGSAYELKGDLGRAIDAMERACATPDAARYPFLAQRTDAHRALRRRLQRAT